MRTTDCTETFGHAPLALSTTLLSLPLEGYLKSEKFAVGISVLRLASRIWHELYSTNSFRFQNWPKIVLGSEEHLTDSLLGFSGLTGNFCKTVAFHILLHHLGARFLA